MKHAILRSALGGAKKGTVGQDIYDIYTTQSFTCEVEMMGCAWVQPLMYFSLLNVPMFRGSYLIFEVNHRLTPGNMTTTFKGARMGKFATSFVEDMFTDESDISNAEQLYEETERNAAADVYNDCEYKVYPLVEDSNLKPLDNATIEKSRALMNKVMDTLYGGNKGKEYKIASAGIVGNMFKESSFDYLACGKDSDSFFAAGLCGWNDRYKNLTKLLTKNPNKRPSAEELLKNPIIVQKMEKFGVEQNLWNCGDEKAMLIRTIKIPRNLNQMNQINGQLPRKNYKKERYQNQLEMLENDEYETAKNSFYHPNDKKKK
jgi:hypothetical protein